MGMRVATAKFQTSKKPARSEISPLQLARSNLLLQRKCVCGGTPGLTGECEECSKKTRSGLRTKLTINEPGDQYEKEADRVSEQVMRMKSRDIVRIPPSAIQRLGTGFEGELATKQLRRLCECEGEAVDHKADAKIDAVSGGRPLTNDQRAFFEPRFGVDFSRVRIHDNDSGDAAAPAVSDSRESFAAPIIRQHLAPSAFADIAAVQRDIAQDEIEEQLVTAFLSSQDTVQRQADSPEDSEDAAAGERILMQAKLAGPRQAQPAAELKAAIYSLEGRGDPLPSALRDDMEGRFGHDFSGVRVHADASAARLARQVNARAFTIGRNVAFASGEYAPNGTAESRRLLAHELTHVIQQGRAGPRLQRKISVAGKDYTPSAKYLSWLNANFGPAMKEFVEDMHNGGSPPVFLFSSFEQMGFEVRTRANAIKGIEEVHKGCCGYYGPANPPYLDSAYWDHVGADVDFKMKSPLPAGKHPSDAIQAIFAPGAGTRLECLSMTMAIEYYSMLKGLGAAKFDAQFAGGIEIHADPAAPSLVTGPSKKYDVIAVASKGEILPGDWVYFKNFKDYTIRVPDGYWQGENAIYLGAGMYRGFGVDPKSETELNQELVDKYNSEALPHLSKTVADLIADGGGLLLDPVVRPIISKIAP